MWAAFFSDLTKDFWLELAAFQTGVIFAAVMIVWSQNMFIKRHLKKMEKDAGRKCLKPPSLSSRGSYNSTQMLLLTSLLRKPTSERKGSWLG